MPLLSSSSVSSPTTSLSPSSSPIPSYHQAVFRNHQQQHQDRSLLNSSQNRQQQGSHSRRRNMPSRPLSSSSSLSCFYCSFCHFALLLLLCLAMMALLNSQCLLEDARMLSSRLLSITTTNFSAAGTTTMFQKISTPLGSEGIFMEQQAARIEGQPRFPRTRADKADKLIPGTNLSVRFDKDYRVARVNGKPIIWAFWDLDSKNDAAEDKKIPDLINLSLTSVQCHNRRQFHVQLLNTAVIRDWIDHVHPAFDHLIPAHKADYFRARILDAYGGIYVDADSVGLASFWSLFLKLRWFDLINISWPLDGDLISITTMGPMRAHSPLTSKWIADLHLLLDARYGKLMRHARNASEAPYPFAWSELLRGIVLPIARQAVAQRDVEYFLVNGPTTFGQLTAQPNGDPSLNTSAQPDIRLTFRDTELLMYHNSQLTPEIRGMNASEFLQTDLLLAELLRISFFKCRLNADKPPGAESDEGPNERIAFTVHGESLLKHNAELMTWIQNYTESVQF